ncbi:MAG: hypothetical protein ABJF88_14695 [Rhodothermales bacterium]
MRRLLPCVLLIALSACASPDDAPEDAPEDSAPPSEASAPSPAEPMSTTDLTVAASVAALPEEFRASASVHERTDGAGLVELRSGEGPYICLADDPADDRFHVACYHESLEPFMARGRALRAEGRTSDVDSVRFAEVEAGTLPMPSHPAALYSLSGDSVSVDESTGAVTGARPLYVVYIAYATAETTGLPTTPTADGPWLMFPGTPKAHIMFTSQM